MSVVKLLEQMEYLLCSFNKFEQEEAITSERMSNWKKFGLIIICSQ